MSDDMKVSKGLEFPVVEAARVLYVAATRATQILVIGVGESGGFSTRLRTLTAKPANEVS